MAHPQRRGIVVSTLLLIFLGAVGLRLVPLHWSPLPATLDGFSYAALVETTLATAHLPLERIHSDEIVYTLTMTLVSLVGGKTPLEMAQIFIAFLGASSALTTAAVAGRIGHELEWPPRQTGCAAILSGFGIAVTGLYVRRTGVPDEGAIGLVLVPLCVLAVHRTLLTGSWSWTTVAGLVIGVLPLLHNMSALVALLTATSLLALHSSYRSSYRGLVIGGSLVGAFWFYFWGYYELAARLGLGITYRSVVGDHLGLFVAWVIVLIAGARWLRHSTNVIRQIAFLGPFGLGFAIISLNMFTPIFPGTVPSPPMVVALVSLYLIPTVVAAGILDRLFRAPTGAVAFSIFLGPAVLAYYALTADLTPAFFDLVLRIQTFTYPAVFIFMGLTIARVVEEINFPFRREWTMTPTVRTAVVLVIVVSLIGTIPLAYVNLDTGSYPSTTTQSEFQAATFATTHLNQQFATADPIGRVSAYYYGSNASQKSPTRRWLSGGPPPACPTVSRRSWTQSGAHLYPTAPESISAANHHRFVHQRNLIYTSNGLDPIYLTVPRTDRNEIC